MRLGDMERTRNVTDGRTSGRTGRQTDGRTKTIPISPIRFAAGDKNIRASGKPVRASKILHLLDLN